MKAKTKDIRLAIMRRMNKQPKRLFSSQDVIDYLNGTFFNKPELLGGVSGSAVRRHLESLVESGSLVRYVVRRGWFCRFYYQVKVGSNDNEL